MLGNKDQCSSMLRRLLLVMFLIQHVVWTELWVHEFGKWSSKLPLCFQNENVVLGNYSVDNP